MLYYIVKDFMKLFLKLTRGLKIFGKENIPKKGAFLVVANHLSNNDPFVVAASTSRPLAFMAKDKLFGNPVSNMVMRMLKAFPVNREGDPREVLNQAVKILEKGHPTSMFPEGTRNKVDDSLQEFKKGAALVAIRAGVPVVPVAILGTNKKKGKIYALYGKPIQSPENTRENLNKFNQEMHKAVSDLLEELKKKVY